MLGQPVQVGNSNGPISAAGGLASRQNVRAAPAGRLLCLLATAAALAACAPISARDTLTATQASEVPLAKAIVTPPPGGPAVIAVLERQYVNAVSQEIALATASAAVGQNAFHASLFGAPTDANALGGTLRDGALALDEIETEMSERMPGVDMRVSPNFVQNKYGPFGYAIGRAAAGDLCLYAWQRIEPAMTTLSLMRTPGAIAVRLRLCQQNATEADLLPVFYGYTINAYLRSGTWDPYGQVPAVPEGLGELGKPITPLGLGSEAGVTFPPVRAVAPPVRPRAATRPAAERLPGERLPDEPRRTPATPEETYPVVPPPPGGG